MSSTRFVACSGLVLMVVAVAACASGTEDEGVGGASSSSASKGTTTSKASSSSGSGFDFAAYCDARATLGCPGFDAAACKAQEGCSLPILKDAAEPSLFECLSTRCLSDECFLETKNTPLSAAGSKLESTCVEWEFSCDLASSYWCDNASYNDDATILEIEACIAPSSPDPSMANCQSTEDCLSAIAAAKFQNCRDWF